MSLQKETCVCVCVVYNMSNYVYIIHLLKITGLKSPSLNIVQVDR